MHVSGLSISNPAAHTFQCLKRSSSGGESLGEEQLLEKPEQALGSDMFCVIAEDRLVQMI